MDKFYLWVDNQPLSLFADDNSAVYYEERPLLAANSGDIIVLDFNANEDYLDYLQDILNKREILLLSVPSVGEDLVDSILQWEFFNDLKEYLLDNNYHLRTYIADERLLLLSEKLGIKTEGVDFYLQYHTQRNLIDLLVILGFEPVKSLYIKDSNMHEIEEFINSNPTIICKPDSSIGGRGIYEINSYEEWTNIKLTKNTEYILQTKINVDIEGSIQFIKSDDRFNIYLCRTFNKKNSFCGFAFPLHADNSIENKLNQDANTIMNYFDRKFSNDIKSFGIDFIVSGSKIYYHDLNPRNTAVMYVLSFIKKIGGQLQTRNNIEIVNKNYHLLKKTTFLKEKNHITILGYQFSNEPSLEGIIIINAGTIKVNLLQIVYVSQMNNIEKYKSRYEASLVERGIISK